MQRNADSVKVMKCYGKNMLIIFAICGIVSADIRLGIIRYMSDLDTMENTLVSIRDMLEYADSLDLVIAYDGALIDGENRCRIIFGRNDDGDIVFAPADTEEASMQTAWALHEICSLAAVYRTMIIPGTLWEVDSANRLFRSAPIIGRDGKILRIRRKAHQFYRYPTRDSTIHTDTILTRDSSLYAFYITLTNESRDIPVVYGLSSPHRADIWLFLKTAWFRGAGHPADEFESSLYPDFYEVHRFFPDTIYKAFYMGWLRENCPVFISELTYSSGAFWMQNLADSLLPPNQWYRMNYYEEMVRGIVVSCDPHEPNLFTGIHGRESSAGEIHIDMKPNPFNSSCRIYCPQNALVEIFDISGKAVFRKEAAGFVWRGEDMNNEQLPSGIYFVKAMALGKSIVKKAILMR